MGIVERSLSVVLILACGACAGASPEVGSANQIEEALFAVTGEALSLREGDLITECARVNGLDGYTYLANAPSQAVIGDGLEGRDFAVESGTGAVALESEFQKGSPARRSEPDAAIDKILETGPISDVEGNRYEGGCRQWAQKIIGQDERVALASELADDYGQFIERSVFESPEYSQLQQEWVFCMNEFGLDTIRSRDDANQIVRDEIDRWLAGSISYDDALATDRRVGIAWWDCQELISERRESLFDIAAADFAAANSDQFERLERGTGG